MKLHELRFAGVTIKNLTDTQANGLKEWRQNVLSGLGRRGLWVYGPRAAGTTYAAQVIVGKLAFSDGWNDGTRVTEYVEAIDLIHTLRTMWATGTQARDNSQDFAMWQEAEESEAMVNHIFYNSDLLWVDDFHADTLDWNIWRKHVQPYLERRVKHGMPTVISTTMFPNDTRLPKNVVDGLFIPVFCDGQWRGEG